MRKTTILFSILFAAATACGSDDGGGGVELLDGFDPPAPGAGELQVIMPIVHDIAPGADVTLCTYLPETVDLGAADVVGAMGFQSEIGGHHAILYQAISKRPVDTHECTDDDMANSIPLAITGGEASAAFAIPDGLSFRSEAGKQLFVQTHWINSTEAPISGQAAFNMRVQPVSDAVQPASVFAIVDTSITIPAHGTATEGSSCTFPRDVQFATLGGHAHEWGSRVRIYHAPSPSGPEEMMYDQAWDPTKTFDTPTLRYTKTAPFVARAGATLRVECSYDNTTDADLHFPREMCASFGFYFPGNVQLNCVDGRFPN